MHRRGCGQRTRGAGGIKPHYPVEWAVPVSALTIRRVLWSRWLQDSPRWLGTRFESWQIRSGKKAFDQDPSGERNLNVVDYTVHPFSPPVKGEDEPRHFLFLLLLVASCVLGCERAPPTRLGFVKDSTESGIPWARNTGSGRWTEDERWNPTLSLRIGELEGDGPGVFGRVSSLTVDTSGNLFVLDDLNQEIRVFGPEGHHRSSFGRRGQGPGEFRYAEGISLGPDGSVWVYDSRRATFIIFRSDGTYLGALSRPRGGSITPWPGRVLADGTVIDWLFSLPDRDRGRPLRVGSRSVFQPIRLFPDELRVDTLPAITHQHETIGSIRIPLSAKFSFAVDPSGGVWFSHERQYTFFHRGPGGDTLLVVSLEGMRADPLSEQEVDSLARGFRLAASSYSLPVRSVPGPNDFPSSHPVVDRIMVDDAGHVLVFPRLQGAEENRTMDVFLVGTGEYLGRVALPVSVPAGTPAWVGSGSLYFVEPTDLGLHRVVRLALY